MSRSEKRARKLQEVAKLLDVCLFINVTDKNFSIQIAIVWKSRRRVKYDFLVKFPVCQYEPSLSQISSRKLSINIGTLHHNVEEFL